MKHILFGSNIDDVQVAILIKDTALNELKMLRFYTQPCELESRNFIGFSLDYGGSKKVKASVAKDYIQELLPEIDEIGINTLLVCDGDYFKKLTKLPKTEPHHGYVCPCKIDGYEHMNIILCPNYNAIIHNPDISIKITRALETLTNHVKGDYEEPGKDIIHEAHYPDTIAGIKETLDALHQFDELEVDIEAESLEFWNAGISTISFAWDKHCGVAFGVDRMEDTSTDTGWVLRYRNAVNKAIVRQLLKEFLTDFKGKFVYHNIGYDGKVLVYNLWMQVHQNYVGMIEGIKVITKNFDDTKLIAYLATNNAVQNTLDLKSLSAEFTGNYAEDVKDTTKVPMKKLLPYNLKDTLATCYVKEKYTPIMIADQQQAYYEAEFKEYAITLMQTELCGMPIDPIKVQEAKKQLLVIHTECMDFFDNSDIIKVFHMGELVKKAARKTADAAAAAKTDRATKVYQVTDSVIAEDFNPNSSTQLQKLLFDYLGYEVIDLTKNKQPATGGKTIKKLMTHAKDPEHLKIFEYLIKLADANVILNNFIPAFENAQQMPDGTWRLFGNFNLGGTQSLRLSSSNPNLQNLPSGSTWAKLVKQCFPSTEGWVFGGSDFSALEDVTGALLTRDPQRLKIYTDGYDGHNLRTLNYWPDKMPDIKVTNNEDRCFIIKQEKETLYIKAGTVVQCPNGKTLTIEEYYDGLPRTA